MNSVATKIMPRDPQKIRKIIVTSYEEIAPIFFVFSFQKDNKFISKKMKTENSKLISRKKKQKKNGN